MYNSTTRVTCGLDEHTQLGRAGPSRTPLESNRLFCGVNNRTTSIVRSDLGRLGGISCGRFVPTFPTTLRQGWRLRSVDDARRSGVSYSSGGHPRGSVCGGSPEQHWKRRLARGVSSSTGGPPRSRAPVSPECEASGFSESDLGGLSPVTNRFYIVESWDPCSLCGVTPPSHFPGSRSSEGQSCRDRALDEEARTFATSGQLTLKNEPSSIIFLGWYLKSIAISTIFIDIDLSILSLLLRNKNDTINKNYGDFEFWSRL